MIEEPREAYHKWGGKFVTKLSIAVAEVFVTLIGKRSKHLGQTNLLVLPISEFLFWFIVDENSSPVLKEGTNGSTLTFLISTPTWWLIMGKVYLP